MFAIFFLLLLVLMLPISKLNNGVYTKNEISLTWENVGTVFFVSYLVVSCFVYTWYNGIYAKYSADWLNGLFLNLILEWKIISLKCLRRSNIQVYIYLDKNVMFSNVKAWLMAMAEMLIVKEIFLIMELGKTNE